MRSIVKLALVVLIAIAPVAAAHAEEATPIAAPAETRDPFADWYGSLTVRSGFLWNLESKEWTGFVTVPVIGYRAVMLEGGVEVDPEEDAGPTAGVVALTYNLGDLRRWGIDVSWAENFGVNVGPVLRYDFETGETSLAILASVVDVSLDAGNAERHRTR